MLRNQHLDHDAVNGKGAVKISDFIVIAYICLAIPVLLMLAFLEPRNRRIFLFVVVGMTIALIASQVNTYLLMAAGGSSYSDTANQYFTTVNLTPVSEEILKALPVLFFTFVIAEKRNEIIPVAYAVGFGFAIMENVTILLQSYGSITLVWAFSRTIGAGLMHGICTASVGMGMSLVKYKKQLFIPGTFSLLIFAILYHSIFNTLVQGGTKVQYLGIALPIITYIPFLILHQRSKALQAHKK